MKQRDIRETVVEDEGRRQGRLEGQGVFLCDVSRRRRRGKREANQTQILIPKNVHEQIDFNHVLKQEYLEYYLIDDPSIPIVLLPPEDHLNDYRFNTNRK